MRRGRLIYGAVLVSAIVVVVFQAYLLSSLASSLASSRSYFSPSNSYANPTLTLTGQITATPVSPACALYANPPCAAWVGTLYYITIQGENYRLIFPTSMKPPVNGDNISVTGTLVTPSSYQTYQYTPPLYFRGDIYVTSYSNSTST